MRRVITATAVVLALSGCSATPAPTAAAPTPSPAGPVKNIVLTVPKPRTAAPALATTGSAWLTILTSLSAYGQWLLANPDPSLAGNVTTPGCAVAGRLNAQLTSLINDKAYVVTAPPAFVSVTGPTPAPTGEAVLYVTASRPAEQVVSRTNPKVTITAWDALPQSSLEVTLDQGADGKWRYCTIERVPDEADPAIPLL
jgi:hypothetical protein